MEESTKPTETPQLDGTVFVKGSLNPYGESGRRLFAMMLMNSHVPSQLGDPAFLEITQGRAERAAKSKKFFSTCGELAMMLLHHMGYRGRILNRELAREDGVFRSYQYGQNIAYLYTRAKELGAFIEFKPGVNAPKPGDICYILEPDGSREHVFVFREETEVDGAKVWVSYDAGQTFGEHNWNQCAKLRERVLVNRKLEGRVVKGWLDINQLELTQDAFLHANQRG